MTLEDIRALVEELFKYRDDYYHNEGSHKMHQKNNDVEIKMKEVLSNMDNFKDQIPANEKGQFHFLKGKALNIGPEYNPAAEEQLGRATKFNIHEAWNELGECMYKKGDLKSAQTCFQKALKMERDPVYLRNISMLMRSLPCASQKVREENIAEGLQFAREALKKNISDGRSWLVLGNSYLASFFTVEAKLDVLRNCKSAYTKAEEDTKAAHLPELHYSKFQIAWYEEDYISALNSLKKADELEPTWPEPRKKHDDCLKFLSRLTELIDSKGQVNQRKLSSMVNSIKPSQLGPFEHGGTGLTANVKPDVVPLSLLAEGTNHEKIVQGKVVCTVVPESGLPFSFCMVDKDSTCRAVMVYNWASNCGVKIGDSVAIVAPVLRRHNLEDLGLPSFFSLRVCLPLMLVINRRCVSANQVAQSVVISTKKSD